MDVHIHILSLDTSSSRPVVTLSSRDQVLSSWIGPVEKHHSETLLAGIDECLKNSQLTLEQISAIAVGQGPGMFTGLRIGVATAKFLSDALDCKLIGFSSLLIQAVSAKIALTPSDGTRIWAVSDAKSNRVYASAYYSSDLENNTQVDPNEAVALFPQELAPKLQESDILVGEGAQHYLGQWPANVTVAKLEPSSFAPAAMARVSYQLFQDNSFQSSIELQPKYLKTGQAHLP